MLPMRMMHMLPSNLQNSCTATSFELMMSNDIQNKLLVVSNTDVQADAHTPFAYNNSTLSYLHNTLYRTAHYKARHNEATETTESLFEQTVL